MDADVNDLPDEDLEHWKHIVRAVSRLNHINRGVQSVIPRVASASQTLEGLRIIISSLQTTSAANILEHELKGIMNDFYRAAEALDAERQTIQELISLLDQKRAELSLLSGQE